MNISSLPVNLTEYGLSSNVPVWVGERRSDDYDYGPSKPHVSGNEMQTPLISYLMYVMLSNYDVSADFLYVMLCIMNLVI